MNYTVNRFNQKRESTLKSRVYNKSRKRYKFTFFDPSSLTNSSLTDVAPKYVASKKFVSLPIDNRLKSRIESKGFDVLSEIQDKTFELLHAGDNVVGIASTGTGKTAAYLIPLINQLLSSNTHFQTLILVPTRELALQVEQEFKSLTKGLDIYCNSYIGGTSVRSDIRHLKGKNHVVIGTPGRILDLINQRELRLTNFYKLILDEFDRMLDMGFVHDVLRITNEMENRKQTILFSATENKGQSQIINQLTYRPKRVQVSSGSSVARNIEQEVVKISKNEDKLNVLLKILHGVECKKVIVFTETKRMATQLSLKLKKAGVYSDEIHGDKSLIYRKKALNKFKGGNIQVLVATDVAARGIDVDDVTHVINYQAPQNKESYIHRIGRTGRAGKKGKAITLLD